MTVYVLVEDYTDGDDSWHEDTIGIYSTKENAKSAWDKLQICIGDERGYGNVQGYSIDERTIDSNIPIENTIKYHEALIKDHEEEQKGD